MQNYNNIYFAFQIHWMNFYISKYLVCAILIQVRAKFMCPSLDSYSLYDSLLIVLTTDSLKSSKWEEALYFFCVLKSQPFSFYKYAYLRALCLSLLLVYLYVWHMSWNPWNYSYRWLWVTMCALEIKPGCLQEQHVLQTTKLTLQLPPTPILFLLPQP